MRRNVRWQAMRFVAGGARVLVVGSGLAAVVSCSSNNGTGPNRTDSGSLIVTVTIPSGVPANVTVAGPGGEISVTATDTLTGLAPGTYYVTAKQAQNATGYGTILYNPTVTGGTTTVAVEKTATASVSYAMVPGTGNVWVLNMPGTGAANTVYGYAPSAIGVSASLAPTTGLTTQTGSVSSGAIAFDNFGNMWVADGGANTVTEYTTTQLGTTGTPTPALTLSAVAGSLNDPVGLAFDISGNLWVANRGSSTLVAYSTEQLYGTPVTLMGSGSPAPAIIVTDTARNSLAAWGLAFDGSGNLWVTNPGLSTVVEFLQIQLTSSGIQTPGVTLSANNGSIDGPLGVAFDFSGDLWIANSGNSTLVQFASTQLSSSGNPVPAVILTGQAGSGLSSPSAITFDNAGDLWVTNLGGGGSFQFYPPSSIMASNQVSTPFTFTTSGVTKPIGVAMDPDDLISQLGPFGDDSRVGTPSGRGRLRRAGAATGR